jgi:hypothetical protein
MEKLFKFFLQALFKKKQDVIFRTETIVENKSFSLAEGVEDISDITFYNGGTSQLVVNNINAGVRGGMISYSVTPFERINQQFEIKFINSGTQSNLCVVTYKQFQTASFLSWEE